MQCPRCQHENAADAAFCDECGARLEAVCSGCGESNRLGAKFCRKCGQALSTAAPSAPSRFETPQSYTPKHLAEKILTSKAALEGERKQVTGRDAEMELLRQALERAGRSQGQVVAIVGEPGVGKSRLVWEFTHSHRSRDWLILEAASVSYGKATPYFPVIDLLRRYFQIEGPDDSRRIRERVTGKLLSLDRTLESTLAVFLSLLDVPVEDPEWTNLAPVPRQNIVRRGWRTFAIRLKDSITVRVGEKGLSTSGGLRIVGQGTVGF
jgi:hypothetical protein